MLSKLLTKSAEYAYHNPAAFLRYTTAGIYTLSTMAQTGGLLINDKIPAKEKNFLIIQETLNGILQLGTFMTLATGFEKWGKKLVETGKIVGTNVAKNAPAFKKGIVVGFSLLGTVLAFNIITPLIRNPLAQKIQKWLGFDGHNDPEQLTRPIIAANGLNDNRTRLALNTTKPAASTPFTSFEQNLKNNSLPRKTYNSYQPAFRSSGSLTI